MSEDAIQKNLKAALDQIISEEKLRLHELYNESDKEHADREKMLKPVFEALTIIKNELPQDFGAEISLAPAGHMATVQISTSTLNHSIRINDCFD